jgi:hypothetical protein
LREQVLGYNVRAMMPPAPCRILLILIAALLTGAAGVGAETGPLPYGWRLPGAGELAAPWRATDPDRHLRAVGDFNGDGEPDTAAVLVAEAFGARGHPAAIGVFAWLSQPGRGWLVQSVHILEHPLPVDFRQFGIATRPPGRYVTACGAGYGDACAPGEPDAVDLEHPGIECCLFESVTGIFWWSADAGRFEGVPVSD